ncbi:MAG: methionyl-tRNA formyltransferase [Rickettsiales bacterium]
MNIVFMGCAKFGIPALQELYNFFNLKAIFTAFPKPKGRKLSLVKSEIHDYAEKNMSNIPIINVKTMRSDDILQKVKNFMPDLIVVVAYGFILPKEILNLAKYGCINIHPSSLPQFRGASPLQFTILNKSKQIDICIIKMEIGIDDGDIFAKETISIDENIDITQLSDLCSNIGAKLLNKTINNIDSIVPQAQIGTASYARKITKFDGLLTSNILNNLSVYDIKARFLAFKEWPGLYFYMDNVRYKIIDLEIEINNINLNNNNNNNTFSSSSNNVNDEIANQKLKDCIIIDNKHNENKNQERKNILEQNCNISNVSLELEDHYSENNFNISNVKKIANFLENIDNYCMIDKKLLLFKLKAKNGYIIIKKIQAENKSILTIKEFLNGFKKK